MTGRTVNPPLRFAAIHARYQSSDHALAEVSRHDLSQLIRGAVTARRMHRRVEVGAAGQIIRARLLRDFVEHGWARMNIGRAADAPETS